MADTHRYTQRRAGAYKSPEQHRADQRAAERQLIGGWRPVEGFTGMGRAPGIADMQDTRFFFRELREVGGYFLALPFRVAFKVVCFAGRVIR
jgi:hypothetical protein